MKAKEIMTREIFYVLPQQPLAEAYRTMTSKQIRHLPVVEHGRLVGILSDRDVLLHAKREAGNVVVERVRVSEAMTESPMTVRPDASISRAAELMLEYKIDALPVADAGGNLIGLVTSSDLLVLLIGDNHAIGAARLPFSFELSEARAA